MKPSTPPFRLPLIASILIVSAIGMAQAPAANAITVSFNGTLSTDATKTVSGSFKYDQSKTNDAGMFRRFTFTGSAAFQHVFQCSGNVSQSPTPANATYVIATNVDAAFKKVQLTIKTGGKTYTITLNTPNPLNPATALPDCSQYPVPAAGAIPGTGTLTVNDGGVTTTYNIKVTMCM